MRVLAGVTMLLGCSRTEPTVPFGPGLVVSAPNGALTVSQTYAFRAGWASTSPPPTFRLRWWVSDSSVLIIDSTSANTATAYVRGLRAGRALVYYEDRSPAVGAIGSVPVTVAEGTAR